MSKIEIFYEQIEDSIFLWLEFSKQFKKVINSADLTAEFIEDAKYNIKIDSIVKIHIILGLWL
jgi:hypothetical protein